MDDARRAQLANWARGTGLDHGVSIDSELIPVSDDASFRRYFRFPDGSEPIVWVDAPPEHEDNPSFVAISQALLDVGLTCPKVLAWEESAGFLAVTDLGDRIYLAEIIENPASQQSLYRQAVEKILVMQQATPEIPNYDHERLLTEMRLFDEWFLKQQLGITLTSTDWLDQIYDLLIENALIQPQRFVHRDYHCRNLMIQPSNGPGIIDFQDAVMGPVTYDLVSLYKDCYYHFERSEVVSVVTTFQQRLAEMGVLSGEEPLLRWFDLMGAQRHLKCAGIFSRLHLRDGKPAYLGDIPLVIDYLIEVSELYDELQPLGSYLSNEVLPRLQDPLFTRNVYR